MEEVNDNRKRARDEINSPEIDSPEVKRLREDLLDGLDDDTDFSTSNHDLDSFMKSFEEEITASPSAAAAADLVAESDDLRPDLGYLLGASDDELGIPPPPVSPAAAEKGNELSTELDRVEGDFGSEFWDGSGYDSFGFELEGLFEYSDLGFGFGDVSRRPETLPAQ